MADDSSGVYQDIKALQSSILVLRQKIKYLVHNEKILGRNILILNKKIAATSTNTNTGNSISDAKVNELMDKMNNIESKIKNIESNLELFSKRFAKSEDVKEIKYIIDNINPLEYTTISQVKKLIKENK